jgi:upstream activation factor subunit UAF30
LCCKLVLVREGDLETLSAKKIRLQLEQETHKDLSNLKKWIDDIVMQCVQEKIRGNDGTDSAPSIKSKDHEPDLEDSSIRSKPTDIDREQTSPPLSDYEIALALHRGENFSLRSRDKAQGRRKKSHKIRYGQDSHSKKETSSGKRLQTNPFTRPLLLSSALSNFMGGLGEMSRPEVVKHLWRYIKDHDLQDPKDKRFILCDTQLKSLFGHERINAFRMNKYLTAHLHDKDEIV